MNPTKYKPDYPAQIIHLVNERGKYLRKANPSALNMILCSSNTLLPKQIDYKAAVAKKLTSNLQNNKLLNFCLPTLNHQN